MTPRPIQPVIMSGGAGTRLWPMSRAARPKQFLTLASDLTLFQETLDRVRPGADGGFAPPTIIGAARHAALMNRQADEIGVAVSAIIGEPLPRNTAAVAAVAAAWTLGNHDNALTLLMPADHHIRDAAGFRAAVADAAGPAAEGRIVTFGIKPTHAHTGYGYIECASALGARVFDVAAFREKPDAETASEYLAGGRHFWNAGIFLFDPQAMLDELDAHAPDIRARACAALAAARRDGAVVELDADEFAQCPSNSVDYAVMEKTARAAVVAPVDVGWSDIGAWSAIENAEDSVNILRVDADGALVKTDGPLVGVIGLEDIVVVATGDAVLVAPKSRAEDVKKIVEKLKADGRDDLL